MAEHEVVDGEAEEVEPTTELTVAPAAPATLFRTDDPVLVLQRATEVANALNDVISKRRLYVAIKGKNHVLVEGWLTLGSMLGVTAICEWTRPVDNGWEARVVAQTLDGRTIGAAEAQCLSSEGKPWNTAEGHAIRSMAQTRATSKALASVLRFVVTLAGYEGTPAEEAQGAVSREPEKAPDPEPGGISEEQVARIRDGFKALRLTFRRIKMLLGAVGADAPKINRADSILKALRTLTPEQGDQLEAALAKEADAS